MEEAGDLSWVIYRQGEKPGSSVPGSLLQTAPHSGLNTEVIYIAGSLF